MPLDVDIFTKNSELTIGNISLFIRSIKDEHEQ